MDQSFESSVYEYEELPAGQDFFADSIDCWGIKVKGVHVALNRCVVSETNVRHLRLSKSRDYQARRAWDFVEGLDVEQVRPRLVFVLP